MIKTLLRHSIIYGVASSLQNAVGFVLLPVYTAYLSMGELGLLEIFLVSINILFVLCQLGLGSAIFKYYTYDSKDSSEDNNNRIILSSAFFFLIGISLFFLALIYLFRTHLSQILFGSSVDSNLINLMLVIVFFQLFIVIPTTFLRIQNKSLQYSSVNAARFLFQIGIIIYFVISLKMKLEGVLIGKALAAFLFAIVFTSIIWKQLSLNFSVSVIRELLSYSLFLVPVSIGILVLTLSNRYFILHFYNSEELGIFTVGNKISSIILLAVTSFQMAWPSIMFRLKDHPNAKQYYSKIFTYFLLAFAFLVICLTSFSHELILLLANISYFPASPLIPILSLSYMFYGLFYVGTVGINIFKKTYYQTIAIIVSSAFNLILNYFLTSRYGIIGASLSQLISFLILGLLAVYFSQKIYHIPFDTKRIIQLGLISLIFSNIVAFGVQGVSIFGVISKIAILFILFPLSLYYIRFFTKDENAFFKEIILKLKNVSTK